MTMLDLTVLDVTLDFRNFDASDELRDEANGTLKRILDLAPYGSVLDCRLDWDGDVYKWCAELHTPNGPIQVRGADDTPRLAVYGIRDALRREIDLWKAHRFDEENRREAA